MKLLSRLAILAAAIVAVTGCKPQAQPGGKAQSPPAAGTNAALQTAINRAESFSLESNPAKRPLLISEAVTNRREWVFRALERGYRETGCTNAAWDAQALAALGKYADLRINPAITPAMIAAVSNAVAARCDDPMIRYMQVRYCAPPDRSAEQLADDYLAAHDAMVQSRHHPLFKFMAGWRAVATARSADPQGIRGARSRLTTIALEDLARDTNAPAPEVLESARSWLEHANNTNWFAFVLTDLEPILERNWGTTVEWQRFLGWLEVKRAWQARSGSTADKVSDAGREGFAEHLAKAEQALEKAWEMRPDSADAARQMLTVELGQGRGRARLDLWFNRAMSLDTNNYDACLAKAYYLEPRWHGSEQETLAFCRQCVAATNWGGRVPLVLAETHFSLARYYKQENSPAYWRRPHVWPDIRASYERFFALNPDAIGWHHNYAYLAFQCGRFPEFLQQVKLFGGTTNFAFFGGEPKFRAMLAEAEAPAGQR